ncbi:hypothetical protein RSAG8_13804, partial [Rhizoctonia solani AG-8 WAC10335]
MYLQIRGCARCIHHDTCTHGWPEDFNSTIIHLPLVHTTTPLHRLISRSHIIFNWTTYFPWGSFWRVLLRDYNIVASR